MKEPFDIPAINNRLEALALYLGIDSDVDSEIATVHFQGTIGERYREIHHYTHQGQSYLVASAERRLNADKGITFNNRRWTVTPIKLESYYQEVTDEFVRQSLEAASLITGKSISDKLTQDIAFHMSCAVLAQLQTKLTNND